MQHHRSLLGAAVVAAAFAAPLVAGAAFADEQAKSAAGVGRTAAGHPDFSGNWTHRSGLQLQSVSDERGICVVNCGPPPNAEAGARPPQRRAPDFPKYKAEHLEKVALFNKEQVVHDPALRCINPGLPRIGPPSKIMQSADEIVMLYDDLNGAFWRVIPTDGRAHREDAEESFLGDSVGRWEGDRLVIETISFNDTSWLTDNGAFHTYNMKVVEELAPEGDGVSYKLTVHDPEVLAEPWVKSVSLTAGAMPPLEPAPCIEMSIDQMTGIESYHPNARW